MTTTRLALLTALLGLGALALPAQAGDPRVGTLACGARTYTVAGNLYGNAYRLTGTSRPQHFVVTYLLGDGVELVKHSPGKDARATLSCTYTTTGSEGRPLVGYAEGFLTPAR